jgi:MFS family permease
VSISTQGRSEGRTGWLGLLVLLTSGIPATIGMSALTPVLPKIEQALAHHSADTYLVKFVSAAAGLAMIVGAPLAGFLSDRLGRKPVLIGALMVFSAVGMLGYWLDDLYSLIASRLVVGAAAAAALTVGVTLIGDRYEGHMRGRLMGLNVTISTFSALIFLPFAGVLGERSWHGPFLLHAIALPLALMAFWLHAPRRVPAPAASPAAAAPPAAAPAEPFPYGLMAFALIAGVITFGPLVFTPFRLRDLGVDSPRLMGLALAANAVTTGLSAAVYGQARKTLSVDQAFMVCFALCGIGGLVLALAPTYGILVAGGLIFGLGMGWVGPNIMTAAAGAASEARRGRVVGTVKGAHLVASFVAVLVLEPISKVWGPGGALLAIGAVSLAMLLFCLVRRTAPAKPRLERAA